MFVLVGILGTFLLLLYLGWAVAVLIAGAFVAAVAGSQTRRMARSVASEPLKVLGAGLLGFFVPLIVGVVLFVTVIGIPLGVLVLMTLGLAAFLGYIVMGIWLGDLLLRRGRAANDGRPIGSALLGIFLLLIVSVIPLVSFLVGWFGLGHGRPSTRGGRSSDVAGRRRRAPASPPGPACRRRGRHRPRRRGLAATAAAAGPPGLGSATDHEHTAERLGNTGCTGALAPQPWGQPQPPAGQPPAGPPPGWGQPPGQGR